MYSHFFIPSTNQFASTKTWTVSFLDSFIFLAVLRGENFSRFLYVLDFPFCIGVIAAIDVALLEDAEEQRMTGSGGAGVPGCDRDGPAVILLTQEMCARLVQFGFPHWHRFMRPVVKVLKQIEHLQVGNGFSLSFKGGIENSFVVVVVAVTIFVDSCKRRSKLDDFACSCLTRFSWACFSKFICLI